VSQHPTELLVSLWSVALDNFPEGDFRHTRLDGADAVALINRVKADGKLFIGTHEDIVAPYNERKRKEVEELVSVLSDHWQANLVMDDLYSELEEGRVTALPITMFDIRPTRSLLVVTNSYVRDKTRTDDVLASVVAPETVEFHLFELISSD